MSWGVNADNISEIFHERSHQSRENWEMVCYACACFRRGAAKAFCSWFKARLNTCPESAMDETTRTQRSYRDKLCICMRGAQRLISGPLQSVSAVQRAGLLACSCSAFKWRGNTHTKTQTLATQGEILPRPAGSAATQYRRPDDALSL